MLVKQSACFRTDRLSSSALEAYNGMVVRRVLSSSQQHLILPDVHLHNSRNFVSDITRKKKEDWKMASSQDRGGCLDLSITAGEGV